MITFDEIKWVFSHGQYGLAGKLTFYYVKSQGISCLGVCGKGIPNLLRNGCTEKQFRKALTE